MLPAEQYRAKAAEYAELLKAARLPAEANEFRRLGRSYLVLAENEEWMEDNRDKMNIVGANEIRYGDAILGPPDRVFDDMWATFRISADGVDSCPFPIGTKVKMRLLQNFHLRDGMIAKEIGYEVWQCDK
jgi:alkanesulfonate monooxygenase SsuD/methylene tetrahydromethanopterin reductase-like flavin-dependent oxidoreductase (luciferase family)